MKSPKILTFFIALFILSNIYITVATTGNIEKQLFLRNYNKSTFK